MICIHTAKSLTKLLKTSVGYDVTQSLCDYLKQLERCAVVSGWSREEAASFLAAGLRG